MNSSNKVILLTGASGNIGKALAITFSNHGYDLILQYNHNKIQYHSDLHPNARIETYKVDLSHKQEVDNFFFSALKHFGKIDILINNAGVYLKAELNHGSEWNDVWDKTHNINLKAAAILSRLCYLEFVKQQTGIIINISSRAGQRGDDLDYLAYAASKSGMYGLTKTLARAGGPKNIYCYSISPGFINTEMAFEKIKNDGLNSIVNEQIIPKIMEVDHLIPLMVLLASGKASYLTGNNFNINGGSYIV